MGLPAGLDQPGSDIAQPGMSDERQKSRLCGRHCFRTFQGSKTSDAERLPEARRDVTMLAIFTDPEHKVLTYVYSSSVVRFRSACSGRPDPHAQDVSCARSKRRNGSPSVTRWVAESMRYGSDQVQGRHPYLVTRASCCGVPFTPTSRKIKVSEAITSAGIPLGTTPTKSTPAKTPVAQSVSRLPGTGGRSP